MNLHEIQQLIHNRIAPLLPDGVVLDDDGTYPKTPLREQLLAEKGLAVIVWEPESDGLIDTARNGTAVQGIYVPIVVEENVKVNRSTGTTMAALKALMVVQAAISGLKAPGSNEVFLPDDTPFQNLGKINGINRIVAFFTLKQAIIPTL